MLSAPARARPLLLALIAIQSLCLIACDDPAMPRIPEPAILVDVSESGGFAVVDSGLNLAGHYGDFGRVRTPMAVSNDRERIVFVAAGETPPELVVYGASSLQVLLREPTASIAARSAAGAVSVHGRLGLVIIGDDGLTLDGLVSGVPGVIRLSGDSYSPTAAASPFYLAVGGIVLAGTRLFVLASRAEDGARYLYELDPITLVVLDSIATESARQISASPGQRYLYLLGNTIQRFDVETGTYTAAVTSPTSNLYARLHLAADGLTVFLTEPGNFFEDPGAGLVYRYTSSLAPRPPLDLAQYAPDDAVPPIVASIATSTSGDSLFVSVGTASRGPLYGPQPAHLLTIDAASDLLLRRTDLEGWGPGAVIPLP